MNLRVLRDWFPGPAVLFCSQWLGLFSKTQLAHPVWEVSASDLALAISAVVAVILSLLWRGLPQNSLRRRASWFAILGITGLATCWILYVLLGRGMASETASVLQEIWKVAYVVAMVSLVSSITTGVMALEEKKPSYVFWIVLILAGIVASLLIYYFFFRVR